MLMGHCGNGASFCLGNSIHIRPCKVSPDFHRQGRIVTGNKWRAIRCAWGFGLSAEKLKNAGQELKLWRAENRYPRT